MCSFSRLFFSFLKLGGAAFGGPAMIAYIKELSVSQNKWLDEKSFKEGVALCQFLPGATAMQVAAFVGLKIRGVYGALTSYIAFCLPSFIIMLVLSFLYEKNREISSIIALFNGLQVIVVAIIANATYSFGKDIYKKPVKLIFSVLSALLLWYNVNPFLVILLAAFSGVLLIKNDIATHHNNKNPLAIKQNKKYFIDVAGLLLFFLLLMVCFFFFYRDFFNLSLLMIKIDLFAFGGGFTSVPLMLHEVVDIKKWMDYKTFMDGIALGQITPGPIVITATFLGYMVFGISGSIVATISIFAPSFFVLLITYPHFNNIKNSVYFLRATKGILASFVGLLLYVTIKFGIGVTWDIFNILLFTGAFAGLIKKVNILYIIILGSFLTLLTQFKFFLF